jgi:hypothetical protein
MKIIFLCSSLEPGRDGVGDYTRRLASELIRQGHSTAALSLNDKYISDKFNGIQQSENTELSVLRLPASWDLKIRFEQAKKYIDDFDPDWLSLQFVIFGFHRKGLPFGLANQLAVLGLGRRWHIMFHELWVGMNVGASKKNILIGYIQKLLIKNIINVLKPSLIHTQTKIYQIQLDKMRFKCGYLPLFSNIPVFEEHFTKKSNETNTISIVIFGSIHKGFPIEDFVKESAEYSKEKTIKIVFVFVGKCGSEQDYWVSICKSKKFDVIILGESSSEEISEVLGNSTIGISTNELSFIEKSGTATAMLEHGLPVICISKPWKVRGVSELTFPIPNGIMQYEYGKIEMYLNAKKSQMSMSNLETTTKLFINAIKELPT